MKKSIVFTVSLLLSLTKAQTECTEENVQICMANMQQFELDEYEAIVPTFPEEQLNDMCKEYKVTDECLDKLIDSCSAYDQHYYRAVANSWDYICEDKKQEYLDIRDCLSTAALHTQAYVHCTQAWEQRVNDLDHDRFRHSTGALNDDGRSSVCNAATEYLNCVYTEVELTCGADAATWQREFDETLIQPILRSVGCQPQRGRTGNVYVYDQAGNGDSGMTRCAIICSVENLIQFEDVNIPFLTEAELEQRCTASQSEAECIDLLFATCPAHDRHYLQGLQDSRNYICEDKKQEYLDVRDCLSRETLHSLTETHCTNIWNQRVEDLDLDLRRGLTASEKSRFCSVATEFLNCLYTEVELECGVNAAMWQRGFEEARNQHFIYFYGCQTRAGRLGLVYFYEEQDGNGSLRLDGNGFFILGLITTFFSYYL